MYDTLATSNNLFVSITYKGQSPSGLSLRVEDLLCSCVGSSNLPAIAALQALAGGARPLHFSVSLRKIMRGGSSSDRDSRQLARYI